MCTVHSFPHNIDHCLTWARSEFEGLLEKGPSEANAYLADPSKYSGEHATVLCLNIWQVIALDMCWQVSNVNSVRQTIWRSREAGSAAVGCHMHCEAPTPRCAPKSLCM
jgi:hypothetical protein